MHFTIERSALLKTLDHLRGIVERRNTIPILSNALMEVSNGKLKMTATDLDIEVSETVTVAMDKSGATTVPAHLFHEIVKKMPDGGQVSVESADHQVVVKCGRSRFVLATLPKEDFPSFTADGLKHSFTMSAPAMAKMISVVRMSMSTEETRYYLNGFYLHPHEGRLRAVSTDGHRLTRYEAELPEGGEGMPGIIVPRRAAGEILRLLGDADGDVEFSASDTKIVLEFGNITIRSKLVDGTFPPYERVIPSGNENILEVPARALGAALDRVSVVMSERGAPVRLALSSGAMALSCRSSQGSTSDEDLEVEYAGQPLEIGFNSRYLGDMLAQIDTPSVRVLMGDAGSPAILEPIGADTGILYVLMPLRV